MLSVNGFAQLNPPADVVCTSMDIEIFQFIMSDLKAQNKTVAVSPDVIASYFLGRPYVARTLERLGEEKLVVNLREFDCLTLVENSLALAICYNSGKPTFDNFTRILRLLRYRTGKINGYPSRLHYFSEWIKDGETKGLITDVTKACGGTPVAFQLGFMSQNPKLYSQLVARPDFIAEIRKTEQRVSKYAFCQIPKTELEQYEDTIKTGDIIGIVTTTPGLDYAHNGIAVSVDNRLFLLHASSDLKKVVVTAEPLADYMRLKTKQSGISVLRMKN
jgi:hypothetical protein